MKSILIDEVEAAIEKIYDSYSISNEDRLLVEAYMDELLAKEREKYMVELDGLTREKIRLERRQEKLLEAHFNDAIPLDLMKREQKSISKQLAAIEHEIKAHNATFDDIRDKLSLVMEMIENCGRTYRQANENIKKLLNQAFFEKIWIEEDDRVTPELNTVCDTVFKAKREIKKSTSASADVDFIRKLSKSGSKIFEQGLNNDFLVEAGGVEPPSENTSSGTSPGADGPLHSLAMTQAVMLHGSVASFVMPGAKLTPVTCTTQVTPKARLVVLPGWTAALSSGENYVIVVL